jgi:hypothetical protein
MLSIGPRKGVKVTKTNRTITVGDSSYLSVSGDGTNPRVVLTRGKENGHLLLIECSLALGFTMVDNLPIHRTELSATRKMKGGDEMLLVWSGTRWVQVSFSKNS